MIWYLSPVTLFWNMAAFRTFARHYRRLQLAVPARWKTSAPVRSGLA
jgi:hypothetical protein